MSGLDDMGPTLSPSARALLDAARPDMAPDAAAVRRMRAGVAAKVGGGLLIGSLATKIGLAAVIATAAVGSIVYATRDRAAPVVDSARSTSLSVESAPAPHEARTAPASHEARTAPEPTAVESAGPALVTLGAPVAGARSAIDLSREVELVDAAMAALAARDATQALSIIATYAKETRGAGQLAEDAAAVEVEATCALDVSFAARAIAAFDAKYPQSAQRARITSACTPR